MLNALFQILAQAANAATTAVAPDAPITVNSVVIIMGAAGVFLAAVGGFIGTLVTAFLTLRNGMKSDLNSAKADVSAAKQDVAAVKADATTLKIEAVHAQLNGELAAQRALIEKSSFAEGVKSETDKTAGNITTKLAQ